MRIGLVLSSTPGYSETFFTSKIKGLQEQGIEVVVFTRQLDKNFSLCNAVKSPKVYNQNVFLIPAMTFRFLSLLPHYSSVKRFVKLEKKEGRSFSEILKKIYLNAHILKQKLDWLHFGFATQTLGNELVAKAIGAKMAVSFRGFDINVYPVKHPNCYQLLWKHIDKVHSISNYLLEKAHLYGLNKDVPYAIITPAVAIDTLPEFFYNELGSPVKIVTLARLSWIKGLDVAIKAMALLKQKGVVFQYYIIGTGKTKDKERYMFQVRNLGLEKDVIFQGKLSHNETLEFLNKTDIYIQSSYNEGFCNAVLEAQAMGKLCIASNIGGLTENIVENETGWLVPVYDASAIANKVVEIINLTDSKKREISNSAIKRVNKEFTIQQQQQKFIKFYTV